MAKKTILSIAAAMLLLPTLAAAKDGHDRDHVQNFSSYTGPANVSTVAESLENTGFFGDTQVVFDGHIIKQVKGDTFIFQDATGSVQIELEDHVKLPNHIDDTTKVRIFGELEGGRTPEVEVDYVKAL